MSNAEIDAPQAPARHQPPPHLSLASFSILLLLLLGIFAFLNPIWKADEMSAWNENIWWSYIPIPLMVLVALKLEGKLTFSSLLLDTMKLTFIKFAITITAANLLWEYWGTPGTGEDPSTVERMEGSSSDFDVVEVPAPTPVSPDRLGSVQGLVQGADGQAVSGALVWIDRGLEEWTFEAPAEPLRIENDGDGYEPSFLVARCWQVLELTSNSDQLHTIVIEDEESQRLANLPLLSNGTRDLMMRRDRGLLRVHCSVHGEAEGSSTWLVTANPFWTHTDGQGRFQLRGVPASAGLGLRAWLPSGEVGKTRVDLEPEGQPSVTIQLQ